MVSFISLGSGSSGNCYVLRSNDELLIIDFGIGIRSFRRFASQYGIKASHAAGLLVTHDHTDHVKSVGAASIAFNIPVYTTAAVHQGMHHNRLMSKQVPAANERTLQPDEETQIGSAFTVRAFSVPHDTQANNGYVVRAEGLTFCLITDAGHVTSDIETWVKEADYLVIEANYDLAMLATGPYPAYLKKRITSGRGHLCNDETAQLLASQLTRRTRRVWLCHLSEENNTPAQALRTVGDALAPRLPELHPSFKLEALPRRTPTGFMELGGDKPFLQSGMLPFADL